MNTQLNSSLSDQIKVKINSLDTFLTKFTEDLNKKIITDEEGDNCYYDIRTNLITTLENIFGKEKDTDDVGLAREILASDNIKNGVLFSYWTHRGLSPERIYKIAFQKNNGSEEQKDEDIEDYRKNPFFKGRRWSNDNLRNNFYAYFKELKKVCKNNAPIDFFGKYGFSAGYRYIKITTNAQDNYVIVKRDQNGSLEMSLPTLNNFQSSTKVHKLVDFIQKIKRTLDKEKTEFNVEFETHKNDLHNINSMFDQAFEEFKKTHEEILTKWYDSFKEAFSDIKSEDDKKAIFYVVLSYQYHDIPYDIHLFLPANGESAKKYIKYAFDLPLACFAISTVPGKLPFSENIFDLFKNLTDALEKYCLCDLNIWEKYAENLLSYEKWRKAYPALHDTYYRASLAAESICYAICKDCVLEKPLPAVEHNFSITKRIKSLESLYTKIAKKINDDLKNGGRANAGLNAIKLSETNGEPDEVKKNREQISRIIKDMEIKDIAGIRIICKYGDYVKQIKGKFEELVKSKDIVIENGNIKEYEEYNENDNPEFYRSTHIWFKFGENRRTLYELKDIIEEELIIEVQIRSVLSHGWADVSHDIYYKTGLPMEKHKEFQKEIGKKLEDKSHTLRDIDESFCGLRNDHMKLQNEVKDKKKQGKY